MSQGDSLLTLLVCLALQAVFLYYFPPHEYLMPLPSPQYCFATHYRRDDPVSGFTEVLELPPNWEFTTNTIGYDFQ